MSPCRVCGVDAGVFVGRVGWLCRVHLAEQDGLVTT